MTSFWTAFVLAPLFVHYEVFFMLGLFRQVEEDLQNDFSRLNAELKLKKEVKQERGSRWVCLICTNRSVILNYRYQQSSRSRF